MATYNESACVAAAIRGLASAGKSIAAHGDELRLLLVDDESPDNTAAIAVSVAEEEGLPIAILSHPRSGLGAAYLRGFEVVIREGWADTIVTLDADGQHDPYVLPDLLATYRDSWADLVIGSRWTKGGNVVGLPRHRRILSRVGIMGFCVATGVWSVRDATTSYRVFSVDVARAFRPGALSINGYSFFSAFVGLTAASGFIVKEHPIVFAQRSGGQSKLAASDIKQFAKNLPKLGRMVRRERRRPAHVVTRLSKPSVPLVANYETQSPTP